MSKVYLAETASPDDHPIRVFKGRGGWVLVDRFDRVVLDEHGEPWEYATEREACDAMASWFDEATV